MVGVFLGSGVITREATLPAERLASILGANVAFVGLTLDPVTGIEPGEAFQPTVSLDDADLTALVIPGGFGCRPMSQDTGIVNRIGEIARNCDGVLTISTGTLLLAATGLLNGQRVAGHWLTREELAPYGADLSPDQIHRHGRLFTTSGGQAALEAAPMLADVMIYGPEAM